MNKPLIIIGASGFGKEVAWLAKRLGINILGFLDDDASLNFNTFYGYPVLGDIDKWTEYSNAEFALAIASPRIRKQVLGRMLEKGNPYFKTLIDPDVIIDIENTYLGDGVIICAGTICTAGVKIGNFSIINKQCSIGHDVEINDFCTLSPKVMLGGSVQVYNGVEIGSSSSVRQQIIIEEGVLIGMGSIIVKPLYNNYLYIGIPAKKIKKLPIFR